MNAYELADKLAVDVWDEATIVGSIHLGINMLRQQADRIAELEKEKKEHAMEYLSICGQADEHYARVKELEKDLHMVQRHYDQLDTNAKPVAMRYGYDGNGYLYIDEGSGSDWKARIKDAEPLYTTPQDQADRIGVLEANHKIQLNINDKALQYIAELEKKLDDLAGEKMSLENRLAMITGYGMN